VSGVLIYSQAQQEGRKLFDESLSEAAALLLSLAEHEIREHGPALGVELMRVEARPEGHELQFQIWTAEKRSAYRTEAAPERPFMPLDASGFGWTSLNGAQWRTYATWNTSHTLQLQIAEPLTRSKELSWWTFGHLGLLALVLLPASLVLTWWILTRSLAPLRRSAAEVDRRSPDDLRPVEVEQAPSEVQPLFSALNRLLARMRRTLQIERRFTADAAHELRSPLAAIRATAQVMRGARNPDELAEASADLLSSVDRSSRLIDQLLVLARLDAAGTANHGFQDVDLGPLLQAECETQRTLAVRKGVIIETDCVSTNVRGAPELLRVLARNLIDNAVRYSRANGHVVVACGTGKGRAELRVSDDGPGIAPEERQRVFERFYRIIGNDETGSGLGLSIVQRIAEIHAATVDIHDGRDGQGTTFVVSFGNRT
jgi:two-component system sensor histidine kinase QseC